jgi:hypothetical protein
VGAEVNFVKCGSRKCRDGECGGSLALSLYLKEKKSEGQMHRGP